MAHDCGRGRHHDRPKPCARGLENGVKFVATLFLQMIGELHNEDAVSRYQADQRDQSDLTIDIDGREAEE